jgi:hypothetical protein
MATTKTAIKSSIALQPWESISLWIDGCCESVSYDNPSPDGREGDRKDIVKWLREYRNTGAVWGVFLVDPDDTDEDTDDACTGGTPVDEIDWTGFPPRR